MINWHNFDAYIPHLDSPLIILTLFDCSWCGPYCFILAFLHTIIFLNPVNGTSQWELYLLFMNLIFKITSKDLKDPYSAHVSFFWWWRPSNIISHDKFSFHSGWGPILGMFLLYEYLELYLPCSYILEDIFLTIHPILFQHALILLKAFEEDLSNEVVIFTVEIRRIFLLFVLVFFFYFESYELLPFFSSFCCPS